MILLIRKPIIYKFSGFPVFTEVLKTGINISQSILDISSFKKEILENKYIIRYVHTSLFNNNKKYKIMVFG